MSEDQMKDNSMESRITALETDHRNFKENVKENIARLFDGMKSMNAAITQLLAGQEELRGDIKTLRAEMGTLRAEMYGGLKGLETKMIRWFVATTLSCAGLAFAAARFVH